MIRLRERPFLLSPGRFVSRTACEKRERKRFSRRCVILSLGLVVIPLCPLRGSRSRRDQDINSDSSARFAIKRRSAAHPHVRVLVNDREILKDNDQEGIFKLSHEPLAISLGIRVTCEKDVSNILTGTCLLDRISEKRRKD